MWIRLTILVHFLERQLSTDTLCGFLLEVGKSPVFLGPVLLHKKQEQESFGIFAGEMVNLRPELGNVQCIGTDREKAIFKGFAHHMPAAKLVLCTKHVKDNILSYLSTHRWPIFNQLNFQVQIDNMGDI